MEFLKLFLFPFAFIYGLAVFVRNWLYDSGILPSKEFSNSVISIGNLSAGGTGKSPMTEYLVRLIKSKYTVATLSRGYKRQTSGFIIADANSTSNQIGDEPLQFKKKFPDTIISVDENRRHGIQKLLQAHPELEVILLDDAFQHRRIKPGISILLSDYGKMFYDDYLLPVGTLREWRSGKKRADIILVTKCPANLTPVEKRIILKKINPDPHQHIYYSHIRYGNPIVVFPATRPLLLNEKAEKDETAILLTGISNPRPLEDYLLKKKINIVSLTYPDHHQYTLVDANGLIEKFNSITSSKKYIITTEKDAMRLDKLGLIEILNKLPIYYIPIETDFNEKEKIDFEKLIIDYVLRTNQKNSSIH